MKILSHRETPFPEDLEGRVNAVANIVNSEIKIATLLHLDDTLAEGSDILSRIRESVGSEIRLTIGRNFSGYCHMSLLPIGAVAEEEVRRETNEEVYLGYKITEAGKKYGIPLAVFALEYGVNNRLSLYSLLGKTASPGKSRAPLNRIKILKLLRNESHLRQIDLVRKIGLNSRRVSDHLKVLKKSGLVNYDSIPELHELKEEFKYEPTGKEGIPETVKRRRTLTKRVFDSIKKSKIANCATVAESLDYPYPGSVSVILSGLEKQGFLERMGYFRGKEVLSRVEVSDKGRKFVDEYIAVIEDTLKDGKSLIKLQSEAERFLRDNERKKDYLRRGIKNYWKVSPNIDKRPLEATNDRIIVYIANNPGARPRNISKDLKLTYIYNYLTPLIKAGVLEKRKIDDPNRSAVGYFIKR